MCILCYFHQAEHPRAWISGKYGMVSNSAVVTNSSPRRPCKVITIGRCFAVTEVRWKSRTCFLLLPEHRCQTSLLYSTSVTLDCMNAWNVHINEDRLQTLKFRIRTRYINHSFGNCDQERIHPNWWTCIIMLLIFFFWV